MKTLIYTIITTILLSVCDGLTRIVLLLYISGKGDEGGVVDTVIFDLLPRQ